MKRIVKVTIFLSLLVVYAAGCTSNSSEQPNMDLTGIFGLTISDEAETSRTHTFSLTQDGEQVTGKYAVLEYVSDSRLEALYEVSGDVSTPGAAELRLTLLQAFPAEAEPEQEITLNVALKGNGDLLHVQEWKLDLPRID